MNPKIEARREQALKDATDAYTKAVAAVTETRAALATAEKTLERAAVARITAFDALMGRKL